MQCEEIGYNKALELLHNCSTKHGFLAAQNKTDNGNYDRVWARDSMICGIAAIISEDKKLIKTLKNSLKTLMKYQHKQGEIPSNVDPLKKQVSYGGTAGRVDAQLWFLIGFGQYIRKTKDVEFLNKHMPSFEKTINLVQIYEFNHKNLIYIPKTGDWADEYIQDGYVLYDQVLYYQAFKEYAELLKNLKKSNKKAKDKAENIRETIRQNYWLDKKNLEKAFHKNLFKRYADKKYEYFLPFFNPSKYGTHFDLFANSLTILCGIADEKQTKKVHKFVDNLKKTPPCFFPVITKRDILWKELENNYGKSFRNNPYEYHNGGIWPMTLGFYSASSSNKNGKNKVCNMIDELNKKRNWEFNEVFHGRSKRPHGTPYQAWSAAGAIIAHQSIENNKEVFP